MSTLTPETYTLSLHDALPISEPRAAVSGGQRWPRCPSLSPPRPSRAAADLDTEAVRRTIHGVRYPKDDLLFCGTTWPTDRKSTRLNSSHLGISYAVFCLKKKK